MSLRTKLLCFFGLLAVLPLLAMGLLYYVQSLRTVEAQVTAQVKLIAERGAQEIVRRHEVAVSDLLLLAENAETQRLFRTLGAGPGPELDAARSSAVDFLSGVWEQISPYYHGVDLRDGAGGAVLRLGERTPDGQLPDLAGEPGGGWPAGGAVLEQPITDGESGVRLGTVVAAPRLPELLPGDVLDARFGTTGYSVVLERPTGRVVHGLRGARPPWSPAPDPRELGFDPASPVFAAPAGEFTFSHLDSTRVAAFVSLGRPPWTVVSITSLQEFSGPFERMRTLNLILVLLVIVSIAVASVLLVRRATRSLEELTEAASEVSRGEFLPALPPAGRDEVGRLAAAFATMVDRIRDMMGELQASRQMAAVGEFASELSHEIRNPLTSVKLNLQRIDRAVGGTDGPREVAGPLRIAMREVGRLERVVRGVLHLGRPRPLERSVVPLHDVAADALEVIRPEAEAQGVRLRTELDAAEDTVLADRDQLRATLLNLLLNAVEAMPDGGEIRLSSALRARPGGTGDAVELTVRDTGPGIPPDVREELFRPFFTTKPEGTGLGLALALRTVEEHGGRLELEDADAGTGAAFRLVLPLAPATVPGAAVP